MSFSIISPAFESGGRIPPKYTRDGENLSPPLQWRDVPKDTRSLALVIEDPDAPSGTFRHWAVYNIKPTQTALREGLSSTKADHLGYGVNDFGYPRYDGPQPPKGHGPHHYHFRLIALDVPSLDLPPTANAEDVLNAARSHRLDETELVGIFQS
ncbi:MAG TPA: YbhB/YbcL family Raf kinase inhibitor-like protein [Alphaproteobacteria bacterium]|nr:YbhB/YbcL family Raf kinase inhibitor-like protein [Alphaproteobacteria bacterium]